MNGQNIQADDPVVSQQEQQGDFAVLLSKIEALDSKEDILGSQDIFEAIARLDGRQRYMAEDMLFDKADRHRIKSRVVNRLDECRKRYKRQKKEEDGQAVLSRTTNRMECLLDFEPDLLESERAYPSLMGGTNWFGNPDGVFYMGGEVPTQIIHHPIMPVRKMTNIESRKTFVTLAYRRYGQWDEITVPKSKISKSSEIVELSNFDLDINSETSKALVRYLSEVEILNESIIPNEKSTSKFGWREGGKSFVPFDASPIFDSKDRFQRVYEALQPQGSLEAWLSAVKAIRPGISVSPRVMLAASFASILVEPLGILPFVADAWGMTEGGKTVTLMIAASVWANPSEHQYLMTYNGTGTSKEIQCDLLNSLPLMLDDSSDIDDDMRRDMESLVYDLCSGKGRSRSNRELGLNRETTWANCILTNGERPLSEKVSQGGAINRILEVECEDKLFEDIPPLLEAIRGNYGWAGREFVKHLKEMPQAKLRQEFERITITLGDACMEKQKQALACILLADELATEWIFKDGKRLYAREVKRLLTNPKEVAEGTRAYAWLADMVHIKAAHFDPMTTADQWGVIDKGDRTRPGLCMVRFYKQALDDLLKQGGFSFKAFISWIKKQKLIDINEGEATFTKVCRIKVNNDGGIISKPVRMVCIYLPEENTDS